MNSISTRFRYRRPKIPVMGCRGKVCALDQPDHLYGEEIRPVFVWRLSTLVVALARAERQGRARGRDIEIALISHNQCDIAGCCEWTEGLRFVSIDEMDVRLAGRLSGWSVPRPC